jgi:hypothetical protein
MEIQIVENEENMVQVHTSIGDFKAIWCSSTPLISKKYIVELDSDDVITLDKVRISDSCNPRIENFEQAICITGFVQEIQDAVMILQLDKHLMMLELSANSDFSQYIGRYVSVRFDEIKLYDTEIY